jgi:hypothetical protein
MVMIGALARMVRVAGCLLLAAWLHEAGASILFVDNFGPGDSYVRSRSWAISYAYPVLGQPFNARFSYPLESIAVALTADYGITVLGGPNEIDVFLMDDATGRPRNVIEAFHFSGALQPQGAELQPALVANSVLHPVLEYGARYWVVVSIASYATTPAVYVDWHWNVPDDGGPTVYQVHGDPTWHLVTPVTLGAYRVLGVLVPEPSTLVLTLGALLAGVLCSAPACTGARRGTLLPSSDQR